MSEYKKYGLLGRKLGHSLSPRIHELIFEYSDLCGEYGLYPMEPDMVGGFVKSLKIEGFAGLNVTIPYKNDVMEYLDYISDEAKKIGSVNTILPDSGKLEGHNSDYFGVEKMLKTAGIEVRGKKVMVLGSGGSAKTVVALLEDKKAQEILLVSRDKMMAAEKFPKTETAQYEDLVPGHGYEVLINTTPVGMYPNTDGCPLDESIIKGFSAVADLIYNPAATMLLKTAKKHGAKCVNGLYMLVAQAVRAQEIWNDTDLGSSLIDRVYDKMKEEWEDGSK